MSKKGGKDKGGRGGSFGGGLFKSFGAKGKGKSMMGKGGNRPNRFEEFMTKPIVPSRGLSTSPHDGGYVDIDRIPSMEAVSEKLKEIKTEMSRDQTHDFEDE